MSVKTHEMTIGAVSRRGRRWSICRTSQGGGGGNSRAMYRPRDLVLGVAGHIDHGKTALVRALTGVDTDRLPDEKRRGLTIDLGFAALKLGNNSLSIIDVPGHE